MWLFNVGKDFALGNSLFGAIKLAANPDLDKYKNSGYGIGFDARESSSLLNDNGFGENVKTQ